MIVLQYNQYYLNLLGLGSSHANQPRGDFLQTFNSYVVLFGLAIVMFPCSAAFGILHIRNVTLALRSILLVCGSVQCIGVYTSIGTKMAQVKRVQVQMQEFVDKVTDADERIFYTTVEQKCRKLTKFISVGYLTMAAGLFAAALLFSWFCMWCGNFDTSTWLLPYSLSVPFDTSTIAGWMLFWLVQCYIGLVYSLSTTCTTTYFVSCCFYLVATCQHFDHLIQKFDAAMQRQELNRIVQIHSQIYDIGDNVADVNSGVIFWMLSVNIAFFGAALYQIEHTLGNLDLMILYDILCLMVSLMWPFGLCYSATLVTTATLSTHDIVYNSNWYEFPVALRKYVPMMLTRSQRPIKFSGFRLIICNLEKFVKINNSACSFYLMFRNIANR